MWKFQSKAASPAQVPIPKNTMMPLQEVESPTSTAESTPRQKDRMKDAKEYITKWQRVAYSSHTDPKH